MPSSPTPGQVSGKIFSFTEMVEKLKRDIDRLKIAQNNGDETEAIDHALNAALTGYHLLEWEFKEKNSASTCRARDLLNSENNPDLNLLHDIATKTKHVTISNSSHQSRINVTASASPSQYSNFSNEQVKVKFEAQRAEDILTRVLCFWQKRK